MSKGEWGKITIENYKGNLRIRIPKSLIGKVHYISSGLKDTPENRLIVDTKIKEIELDLRLEQFNEGSFDLSLNKYKFNKVNIENSSKKSLLELWELYTEYKSKFLSPSTIKRDYEKIKKRIELLNLELDNVKELESILLKRYSIETSRRTIVAINSCLKWLVDNDLLKRNELEGKKLLPKQEKQYYRKHFLKEEVREIIKEFEERKSYYTPFIKFLFLTGCRLEEASALTWDKVTEEEILFEEALPSDTKIRDKTKTKAIREFPLNKELKKIIQVQLIKSSSYESNKRVVMNLVFPSPEGLAINTNNLNTRVWKKVIVNLKSNKKIKVELSLNHTRHTFINLCLEKGISIKQIAYWVGNSAQTIIKNYASIIKDCEVPELYEDN